MKQTYKFAPLGDVLSPSWTITTIPEGYQITEVVGHTTDVHVIPTKEIRETVVALVANVLPHALDDVTEWVKRLDVISTKPTRNTFQTPLILSVDSYKVTQWMQYPEGYSRVFSYVESRGGRFADSMFFGLQMFIKRYLMTPITLDDVYYAKSIIDVHLGPDIFNLQGWLDIVEYHNGLMPLHIRAIKEGSIIPVKNALVTVENTAPGFGWLTSYIETIMLRDIWYGTTTATISYECKRAIWDALVQTSDSPSEAIPFSLHDFGCRGVSSGESAQMGSLAHLVNFHGTDTIAALIAAIEFYNAEGPVGFSVIASEHSTMCANADAENKNDFASAEKMVSILEHRQKTKGGFNIVSCVADTYDVFRFAEDFIGTQLKDRIVNSGGRLVLRPDSGDPVKIPVEIVKILMNKFGFTINSKGYKILPDCIRVLQGDGINQQSITEILELAEQEGIAADNFVLGMGGALLQHQDRDWMKFAMKASAIEINGVWSDVYKDPITDPGKTSKKGRVTTVLRNGEVSTVRITELCESDVDLMHDVYIDGQLLLDEPFEVIRSRANVGFTQ